jgi:hypothetical protein
MPPFSGSLCEVSATPLLVLVEQQTGSPYVASLPSYPLPSAEPSEDDERDIDWSVFLSNLAVWSVLPFSLAALLFTLAVIFTGGQILGLLDRLR